MAAAKKNTTGKETINNKKPATSEYKNQKFGPKALALINKYNLQTDDNYKKLISSYERINLLPKNDPRRPNLVSLWEGEFNRIFKNFWNNFANGQKKQDVGVAGWKDRLNIRTVAMSPDEKRKDLLLKLSPGVISTNRNTKEDILSRAGYVNQNRTDQFNFTAVSKSGQNIYEIENLLSSTVEEKTISQPTSILQNAFTVPPKKEIIEEEISNSASISTPFVDEETEIMTSKVVPDPNLLEFINEGKASSKISTEEIKNLKLEEQQKEEKSLNLKNDSKDDSMEEYVARENMTREEFNRENNIQIDEKQIEMENQNLAPIELGSDFFEKHLVQNLNSKKYTKADKVLAKREYTIKDEGIDPEKRNILSKEGFEINIDEDKTDLSGNRSYEYKNNVSRSKPYHEENPIGYYPMTYDLTKRPIMQELIDSHEREGQVFDEMKEKIEFLRELRNERRHRINMMKIERANSYIVVRARRLAEARELRRLKRREDFNLKSMEKAERLRRLQERQKLIELMKERQLKRSEEKRVAAVLKLERERRLERDAKYRTEIASIDAQIRYEQEMIKRTELKMKAYFTKVHDDELFDKSLKVAKSTTPNYKSIEDKAEIIHQLEEKKRKERVEKITKKFIKNIK
ncbi:hypothetical protein [Spiroplasma floricola]|uniref:Uncharacterized protein n=1 Tax=Spiroplasma floricola 23-6 TaxID=1336749 RepID=A0A2K8SD86_9MOLU|nr:hypothetical protein [Spiroplasma floricola]AUB31437.1 hypothetical protein SFLOR_v1c03800 [Spiroplasma floricola 23-6]